MATDKEFWKQPPEPSVAGMGRAESLRDIEKLLSRAVSETVARETEYWQNLFRAEHDKLNRVRDHRDQLERDLADRDELRAALNYIRDLYLNGPKGKRETLCAINEVVGYALYGDFEDSKWVRRFRETECP